jgi:glutathione S-transferase
LFPLQKTLGDVERCYGVLNTALTGRDFLVGEGKGKYTVADMALWPFVEYSKACGLGEVKRWPNIEGWWRRIGEREQVRRGMELPIPARLSNTVMEGMLQDEEFRTKEEGLEKTLKEAQEKFGYEYKAF